MNGNNNNNGNRKPGMGNQQGPMDRKGGDNTNRGGGDNRPRGNDTRKPNPGMPNGGSYRPDIRGGNNDNDKMKGDKCPDCGNIRNKCSC